MTFFFLYFQEKDMTFWTYSGTGRDGVLVKGCRICPGQLWLSQVFLGVHFGSENVWELQPLLSVGLQGRKGKFPSVPCRVEKPPIFLAIKNRMRVWLTARYQDHKAFFEGLERLGAIDKTSVSCEEVSPLWARWQCLVPEAERLFWSSSYCCWAFPG